MILVHVARDWPLVLKGEKTAADVTLQAWPGISGRSLDIYGDVVLGIYKGIVVSAFDIDGFSITNGGSGQARTSFQGKPSVQWAHLIGMPNPGVAWVQGSARPVKYLDTLELSEGTVPVEESQAGRHALLDGYRLSISADGAAFLHVPKGKQVTILAES